MENEKNQNSNEDYQSHIEDKIGAFVVLIIILVVLAGLFGLGSGGGRYGLAIAIGAPLIAIFLFIKMIKK